MSLSEVIALLGLLGAAILGTFKISWTFAMYVAENKKSNRPHLPNEAATFTFESQSTDNSRIV